MTKSNTNRPVLSFLVLCLVGAGLPALAAWQTGSFDAPLDRARDTVTASLSRVARSLPEAPVAVQRVEVAPMTIAASAPRPAPRVVHCTTQRNELSGGVVRVCDGQRTEGRRGAWTHSQPDHLSGMPWRI